MKIARLIFVLLFPLALLNCPPVFAQAPSGSAPGVETPNGPLAEVPEKLHDFGAMSVMEVYWHDFVVKNVGNAPLEIKKVIKICGTDVGRFNHTIPPGGEVKIPVNLSPAGCGPTGAKKSILVLTNDKNSYFVLSVCGSSK